MARHKRDYAGEKRTEFVGLKLTPSERAALAEAAERAGATVSQHARELCLRRGGNGQIVGGTRRHPDAHKIVNELAAIGNNLNQLSRHCNTARSAPQLDELKETTEKLKVALSRVLSL
jgi:DNA transposition AAA+ family ATPase